MSLFSKALAEYLASEKAGYDGSGQQPPFVADYASSAPLEMQRNPNDLWKGIGTGALGLAAMGSGFLPGVGLPGAALGSTSGAAMLGKSMQHFSDWKNSGQPGADTYQDNENMRILRRLYGIDR